MKKIPFEYKITITYIILGAFWILFSDELVMYISREPETIQIISIAKGWFYVLVTGILLFYLVKKEIRRRNDIFNELLETKKKAIESDNLKSAFLANLSHYVRTPMNSILGFIDLLKSKNTSPEKYEGFLKIINDRSHSLLQTLNSIVEISKIQQGQYNIKKTPFKLNELLNDIKLSAEMELKQKNKPVIIKSSFCQPSGSDHLNSDREIVTQIVLNLVSNAINFTEQGEIEMSYSFTDDNCIISIKDSGNGVPVEKQSILFDEFMYHSSDTISKGEGAGIGLHLSARLAGLIKGKLWLESTGTTGSVFCLKLPLKI
jgi:signal transduction histidine kinase